MAGLYTAAYLFACCTPYLLPCNYSWETFAALAFPFLLAGFVMVIVPLGIYFFGKYGWLSVICLFASLPNLTVVFGFHLPGNFVQEKKSRQIRIISWNVDAFLYKPYSAPDSPADQAAMVDFIRQMDADILCFQDFSETPPEYGKVNIRYIIDSLRYPYHYFSEDGKNYGTIMFSRLPLADSGRIKYTERVYPESMAFIDVLHGKDTLRVYNTHLRSMNLHADKITAENIGYLEFVKEDTAVLFHANRLQRMEYFNCIHAAQAALVKKELAASKHPFVFCADLNAVPSSYVYHRIRDGLKDAFLEAGSGFGQTYHRFSPTLRIDVALMSPSLQAKQYYSPRLKLSDHFPIVTDIEFRN